MKNKIFKLLMLAVCGVGSSGLFAGGMGPVKDSPSFRPFISGEGLYSWPNVNGITITLPSGNVGTSNVTNRGWGGRLGAGIMHAMTERFAYSGEIGWGYYGHTEMPITFAAPLTATQLANGLDKTSGNLDRWGFDALLGLMYTQPKYDLYVKGGALFQNLRVNLSDIIVNGSNAKMSMNSTIPGVLPEIKLGGAYHITDKLAVNLSWMYAFGGNVSVLLPYTEVNSAPSMGNIATNLQNPSMNVVMFGLEYRFG